jgi:hypothetical protein
MATYKIISDNSSLGKSGTTVSDNDLAGFNVAALISGGHLEPVSAPAKKPTKTEQD